MSDEKTLKELYLTLDSLLNFETLMLKHLNGSIRIIGQTEEAAVAAILKICGDIILTKEKINEILNKEV